jgi:hypothetical protein
MFCFVCFLVPFTELFRHTTHTFTPLLDLRGLLQGELYFYFYFLYFVILFAKPAINYIIIYGIHQSAS